jgi:hypothetical protein
MTEKLIGSTAVTDPVVASLLGDLGFSPHQDWDTTSITAIDHLAMFQLLTTMTEDLGRRPSAECVASWRTVADLGRFWQATRIREPSHE